MNDAEVLQYMQEIDRLLGKFWVDGFISSYDREKILDCFPPRLKSLVR